MNKPKKTDVTLCRRPNPQFHSIQEFDIDSQLGEGALATVHLATHRATKQRYAIKTVIVDNLGDSDLLNIEKELEIHSQLDSPFIIKLYDFFKENRIIYMVMEYAQKGNLFKFVTRHHPIGEEMVLGRIWTQAVLAIKYLHDNGIIMRDLKPENLLLDEYFNVKLCDFGWAAKLSDEEYMKLQGGTFVYMSPETLKGEEQGKFSDIWSLGILLFEILHNREPYSIGDSYEEQMFFIEAQRIVFAKETPRNLSDLIYKLLKVDHKRRPTADEILNHRCVKPYVQRAVNGPGTPPPDYERFNRPPTPPSKQKAFVPYKIDPKDINKPPPGMGFFGQQISKGTNKNIRNQRMPMKNEVNAPKISTLIQEEVQEAVKAHTQVQNTQVRSQPVAVSNRNQNITRTNTVQTKTVTQQNRIQNNNQAWTHVESLKQPQGNQMITTQNQSNTEEVVRRPSENAKVHDILTYYQNRETTETKPSTLNRNQTANLQQTVQTTNVRAPLTRQYTPINYAQRNTNQQVRSFQVKKEPQSENRGGVRTHQISSWNQNTGNTQRAEISQTQIQTRTNKTSVSPYIPKLNNISQPTQVATDSQRRVYPHTERQVLNTYNKVSPAQTQNVTQARSSGRRLISHQKNKSYDWRSNYQNGNHLQTTSGARAIRLDNYQNNGVRRQVNVTQTSTQNASKTLQQTQNRGMTKNRSYNDLQAYRKKLEEIEREEKLGASTQQTRVVVSSNQPRQMKRNRSYRKIKLQDYTAKSLFS